MTDEFDRFDDSLREWAKRPPSRTGAEAAHAVTAAIQGQRRRRLARWSGLAAAAALALAVLSAGVLRRPETPISVIAAAGDIRADGLGDGVVLMWLDDETPLYMTFQAAAQGDAP